MAEGLPTRDQAEGTSEVRDYGRWEPKVAEMEASFEAHNLEVDLILADIERRLEARQLEDTVIPQPWAYDRPERRSGGIDLSKIADLLLPSLRGVAGAVAKP